MNDPTLGEACPVYHCLFLDTGGSKFEVRVSEAFDRLTMLDHRSLQEKQRCTKQ